MEKDLWGPYGTRLAAPTGDSMCQLGLSGLSCSILFYGFKGYLGYPVPFCSMASIQVEYPEKVIDPFLSNPIGSEERVRLAQIGS